MCVNHTFILKAKWPRYQQNTNKKKSNKVIECPKQFVKQHFFTTKTHTNNSSSLYKPFEWCLMNRSTKKSKLVLIIKQCSMKTSIRTHSKQTHSNGHRFRTTE